MIEIEDVIILNVDNEDEIWSIEGEVLFESNLTVAFSVEYDTQEDEFINLELELDPGEYDKNKLNNLILDATNNFEE